MAKMTKRDKFVAIFTVLADADEADLADFVSGEIALIDKRAAKPRAMTATQKANLGLKDEIVAGLTAEGVTATDVAEMVDVTVQKAAQLLKQLVAEGRVTRVEGKGKTKTTFMVAG